MNKSKPFMFQLIIIGGFLMFIYIFFSLATSIYRDYRLEAHIKNFEDEINELAEKAHQKPKNVEYFQSEQYKDKYAKENLNLLNPGEKLIIIPQEDQIVKYEEVIIDKTNHATVLRLPIRNQWWEYFFGSTLSLEIRPEEPTTDKNSSAEEEPTADEEPTDELPAEGTDSDNADPDVTEPTEDESVEEAEDPIKPSIN